MRVLSLTATQAADLQPTFDALIGPGGADLGNGVTGSLVAVTGSPRDGDTIKAGDVEGVLLSHEVDGTWVLDALAVREDRQGDGVAGVLVAQWLHRGAGDGTRVTHRAATAHPTVRYLLAAAGMHGGDTLEASVSVTYEVRYLAAKSAEVEDLV